MSANATTTLDAWNTRVSHDLMTDNAMHRRISRSEHEDRKLLRSDLENSLAINAVAMMALYSNRVGMHEVHAKACEMHVRCIKIYTGYTGLRRVH